MPWREHWEANNFQLGNHIRSSLREFKDIAVAMIKKGIVNSRYVVPCPKTFADWKVPRTVRPVILEADGQPSFHGFEEVSLERKRVFEALEALEALPAEGRKFTMKEWVEAIENNRIPWPKRSQPWWNAPIPEGVIVSYGYDYYDPEVVERFGIPQ